MLVWTVFDLNFGALIDRCYSCDGDLLILTPEDGSYAPPGIEGAQGALFVMRSNFPAHLLHRPRRTNVRENGLAISRSRVQGSEALPQPLLGYDNAQWVGKSRGTSRDRLDWRNVATCVCCEA